MTSTNELAQDSVDYIAICRLQSAYADVVTRRAWHELHEVFTPDAAVSIDKRSGDPLVLTGPAAIGTFIAEQIDKFDFFEFVVLNTVVTTRADGHEHTATARVYMCELRHERDNGKASNAFGLYQDRYLRIDGRWWIAGRMYQSMARTGAHLDVFTAPRIV